MPQRIDVRWPAYDTTFSLAFSNIVVIGKLDPKIFTLAQYHRGTDNYFGLDPAAVVFNVQRSSQHGGRVCRLKRGF